MKRIITRSAKIIGKILLIYFIYAITTGIIIFRYYKPIQSDYNETHVVDRFWEENEGSDRVVLLEERIDSEIARINVIENSQQTLDISYYSIKDGICSQIFLGSILEAADRGVKVRIIVDGLYSNIKDVIYTYIAHPNIEIKLFEKFNFIKPWSWNNRLHDKYLIADQKIAIIGGRNIEDRFFSPDDYDGLITNDRDVLILNTNTGNINSVIKQMSDYFNLVWSHEYTKYPIKNLTNSQLEKAIIRNKFLKENLDSLRISKSNKLNTTINWLEQSIPTNKITLIYNPLDRFNKEPWCWYEITNLMKKAENSIFIQSPYIVPTKQILEYINKDDIKATNVTILTNSIASNPNYLATSGYKHNRENIVNLGATIYEYQGPESLHAKSIMIDNRITLIGSFNMDSRSTFLSAETMVVIDSVKFANHFNDEVKKTTNKSLIVQKDFTYIDNQNVKTLEMSLLKKILIAVLSPITYFIQFML